MANNADFDLTKCYSCDFFNVLDEVKTNFATDIYAKLAPELAGLFPTLAIAFFLFTGIRMMLDPANAAGTFKRPQRTSHPVRRGRTEASTFRTRCLTICCSCKIAII